MIAKSNILLSINGFSLQSLNLLILIANQTANKALIDKVVSQILKRANALDNYTNREDPVAKFALVYAHFLAKILQEGTDDWTIAQFREQCDKVGRFLVDTNFAQKNNGEDLINTTNQTFELCIQVAELSQKVKNGEIAFVH